MTSGPMSCPMKTLRHLTGRMTWMIGSIAFLIFVKSGTAIPTHEEVAQFAKRLQTTPEALMQRSDYQWLMRNYRIRKVLEYFNLLTNGKHRKAVLDILRGLQDD